jgi:hypothetical protein
MSNATVIKKEFEHYFFVASNNSPLPLSLFHLNFDLVDYYLVVVCGIKEIIFKSKTLK